MKAIQFLLKFFFVILILFFVAATIYVRIYGKSLVEEALNASLKRNVTLGEATYHFPLGFRAYNVHIGRSLEGGEFLEIKKVIAQLSPNAITKRKFAFDLVFLIEPSLVVNYTKEPENMIQEQGQGDGIAGPSAKLIPLKKDTSSVSSEYENNDQVTEILIERLIVRKGRFQDRDGLTEKGFSFDLENVQLKAEKLVFPLKPGRSQFDMSARLIKTDNPLSGSHVHGSGWIDAIQRDMKAKIEVVEIDGTIGLTADAVSQNNDMEVKGEINIQNLLWGLDKPASSKVSSVNDLVLNALSSSGVEIGAKFAFKTQMDNFQIGQVTFSGSVVTK